MTPIIMSLAGIFTTLVSMELLWRNKMLPPEIARKSVHIIVGAIVASWMFYIPRPVIIGLGFLMFVVVSISKLLKIFSAIHSVKRRTYGEQFFALGIIACAFITSSPWIFAAGILHVSLADGLAGIVGSHAKKPIRYKVFAHFKSVLGTATFFSISMLVFAAAIYFDPVTIPNLALPVIALYSLLIALIENISPYGSDDTIVPVVAVLLLESVRIFS